MPLHYKQAQHLEHEHKATVTTLTFSPKGSFLAVASLGGTLSIWSTTSWKVVYVVAAGGMACLSILWTSNMEDQLLCGLANGVVVSIQITHQVNTAIHLSRILTNCIVTRTWLQVLDHAGRLLGYCWMEGVHWATTTDRCPVIAIAVFKL